jgi:RNA polymerase sigma-70 factor, ECF subfamily
MPVRMPQKKASEGSGPERTHETASRGVNWAELVNCVRRGEADAMDRLYAIFSRGVRYYLYRQLGPQELDDKVHDAFLIVVHAIRRGELREPERLMGFVRTVARRQVIAHIERAVQSRREYVDLESGGLVPDVRQNPEERVIAQQKKDLMVEFLKELSPLDREVLTRFYLLDQPQAEICRAMHLNNTQFRLLKSRAKSRFGEFGRRKLAGTSTVAFLRRTAAL